MPVKKPLFLLLALSLGACVSLPSYRELQRENDALKQEAGQNQNLAQDNADLSDKSTSLALQNHRLKIDKEDLQQQARERDAFYDSVTKNLRQQVGDGRLRISRYKDMLTLDVADEILFDSAKADLKASGREVLAAVAQSLASSDKTVRVVGHTDNEPMLKGSVFASNWELSTARATTVVRFLQDEGGLNPKHLLAAGRGEWMPVATNTTKVGRQRNRRISITLIDSGLLDGSEGYSPPAK